MEECRKKSSCCATCGSCCQEDGEKPAVLLTPRDVFAIAYERKLTPGTLIKNCCQIQTEGTFPLVGFQECPFFEEGECTLIRKPDSCTFYPHGNDLWHGISQKDGGTHCSLSGEEPLTYTYEDYVALCKRDSFFQKWQQARAICSMMIGKAKCEEDKQSAQALTVELLYYKYVLNRPFQAQFESNVLDLIGDLSKL